MIGQHEIKLVRIELFQKLGRAPRANDKFNIFASDKGSQGLAQLTLKVLDLHRAMKATH